MKPWIPRAVELGLAALAAVMLAALVVQRPESPLRLQPASAGAEQPPTQAQAAAPAARATPDAVAALFVAPRVPAAPAPASTPTPAPTPTPPPEQKKPVEATWLKFVGTATGEDGRLSYAFKDTRSGRIIRVVSGETVGGWDVVEEANGQITLSYEGQLYLVKTR